MKRKEQGRFNLAGINIIILCFTNDDELKAPELIPSDLAKCHLVL